MNDPLVSVIMPAYNAEKFIRQSIESVLAQTYTNWELLVINDGSTDQTEAVVNEIARSDNRIKYFYQENGRQGKARNKGLLNAKGEYIAFLDADDLWIPEKLKLQLDQIREKEADLVYSGSYIFNSEPDHKTKMNVVPGIYSGEASFEHFLNTNRVPILTVLAQKKAIDKVNGFSEELEIQNAEDMELWLKMLLAGSSFFAVETPLAHYRLNQSSSTAGDRHVIFPSLNGLKKLIQLYPHYREPITNAIFYRVNTFIRQNNIANWETLHRVLMLKDKMTGKKNHIDIWRILHKTLGKRIFRIIYSTVAKDHSREIVNRNIEEVTI